MSASELVEELILNLNIGALIDGASFEDLSIDPEHPYCYRYQLAENVYLHHFTGDDWARDPHDHPKEFLSIGLSGSYDEERFSFNRRTEGINYEGTTHFEAPWVRSFPAQHIHRIVNAKDCWTLVIVGEHQRDWGFYSDMGPWMAADRYIEIARSKIRARRSSKDSDEVKKRSPQIEISNPKDNTNLKLLFGDRGWHVRTSKAAQVESVLTHMSYDIETALTMDDESFIRHFAFFNDSLPSRRKLVANLMAGRKSFIPEGRCSNRNPDGTCAGHTRSAAIERFREVAEMMDQKFLEIINDAEESSDDRSGEGSQDLRQLRSEFELAAKELELFLPGESVAAD